MAKRSAVLAGLVAAAHLPYKNPAVQSFFGVKNAYAQATPVTYTITMSGQLGDEPLDSLQNTFQDGYTFDCPSGVILSISVTTVYVHAEIGLFAPGVTPAGINLLTGGVDDGLASAGPGQPINTTYGPTTVAGLYTIAIEDQRNNPGDGGAEETSGTYTIEITTTEPLGAPTQTITDGPETMWKFIQG